VENIGRGKMIGDGQFCTVYEAWLLDDHGEPNGPPLALKQMNNGAAAHEELRGGSSVMAASSQKS